MTDRVSPEVREVEREIDRHYLRNPLCGMPFAQAASIYLAHIEEQQLRSVGEVRGSASVPPRSDIASFVDLLVNNAKSPFRWLTDACTSGGSPLQDLTDSAYQAAIDLSDLAYEYQTFETVFVYATLGHLTLSRDGDHLVAEGPMRDDPAYDAYDRLQDLDGEPVDPLRIVNFHEAVTRSVRVRNGRFRYDLTPRTVRMGMDAIAPTHAQRFRLPPDWALPRYTLGQFSRFTHALTAMAVAHSFAHVAAADLGCDALGYSSSVMLFGRDELHNRLRRYTDLDGSVVSSLTEDLTFGSRGITRPDPALQPIFSLNRDLLAIAPTLVVGSSLERNLIVLMNRLPDGRSAYSRLSRGLEEIARRELIADIGERDLRFWFGEIPGWGTAAEVDLVVISDIEKTCLGFEMKSLVAPAEPREIHYRSQEIARAQQQVRARRKLTLSSRLRLNEALRVGDDYDVYWAVLSDSTVGGGFIQSDDVAVVRTRHLSRQLRDGASLSAARAWMGNREYLPKLGTHYEIVDITACIGDYTLDWYGIKLR